MWGPSQGAWNFMVGMFLLGITFGVWKLVEVLVWLWQHIEWVTP